MRVISRKTLRLFYEERYPESKQALQSWYHEAKREEWRTPADLRSSFSKARIVGKDRVVFNILGNRYRLVVKVNYKAGLVYVRFLGTHAEYDKIDVETV